ncbi:MAG: hypothetical protein J5518_09445 [Lachnospiraceae bacterium]|nr:hypothetical protein [Lachnospiraceae bacterium]
MLGRLMKYEWKYIWKKLLIFAGVLLAATGIGLVSTGLIGKLHEQDEFAAFAIGMLGFMFYYTLIMGASIGMSVIVAIRFYKSVYGEEGYVTHTLPVSGREILWSHVLVNGFAVFSVGLIMQISLSLIMNDFFRGIFDTATLPGLGGVGNNGNIYAQMLGLSGVGAWVVIVLYLAIGTLCSVMMIYASVVLGQKWKKHKVFGAVVSYILINGSMVLLSWIILIPFMIRTIMGGDFFADGPSNITGGFLWIALAIDLLYGVIMYLIVDHGLTKRLNLE